MQTLQPEVFLKSHLDQLTSVVLLTSKLDIQIEDESEHNQKVTKEARINMERALEIVREM